MLLCLHFGWNSTCWLLLKTIQPGFGYLMEWISSWLSPTHLDDLRNFTLDLNFTTSLKALKMETDMENQGKFLKLWRVPQPWLGTPNSVQKKCQCISSIRNKIRQSVQLLPNWRATDGIATEIWQPREEKSIKVVTKLCQ